MQPAIMLVTDSTDVGLPRGELAQLDACIRQLPREQLVVRTVATLHALHAERETYYRAVNRWFVDSVPQDIQALLRPILARPDTTFLEPLQQILILRRALAVGNAEPERELGDAQATRLHFDVCRFAADVIRSDVNSDVGASVVERWLEVGAAMMPRLALTSPINPNYWIARRRILLDRLPEVHPELRPHADAIKARFEESLGAGYEDISTVMSFLAYWVMLPEAETVLTRPAVLKLDPTVWLSSTDVRSDALDALLARTSRDWRETIPDSAMGGPTSALPFRDRPFLRCDDGNIIASARELVWEKLTADLFWWLKDPSLPQVAPWQRPWGYLVEAYCLQVLKRIAQNAGCEFYERIVWNGGEADAAIVFKGHVALFEITVSSLDDDTANSSDWEKLREGLRRVFVESTRPGKRPKSEVVLQLARDVESVLRGDLEAIVGKRRIERVYPVLIAADRRLGAPGIWHYLDAELRRAIAPASAAKTVALAVLGFDELEAVDQYVRDNQKKLRGTPPGFLRLLRRWDLERGPAPTWWQFADIVAPQTGPNSFLVEESDRWRDEVAARFPAKS